MSGIRWRYIWRSIWIYRARTILIILSTAIGIFAFGLILGAALTLRTELSARYAEVNPASATLHVAAFDLPTVEAVRRMPEVAVAEGRTNVVIQYRNPQGEWHDLQLFALEDYTDNHVSMVRPWQGPWPPPDNQVLIERTSLGEVGFAVGDSLLVENSLGDQRRLPIAGLVHDMNQAPAPLTGIPYGYVTRDTLVWLGLPRTFNQLLFLVAENAHDQAYITEVAQRATDKLERAGLVVTWTEVPEPGKHFVADFLPTILIILSSLGILALVLSGFLVINVIAALLTQQTRQIGVMKSIGARPRQIGELYMRMVLCFGLGALLLAIPLGLLASRTYSNFIAQQLNFDLAGHGVPGLAIGLQLAVGIITPMAAAFFPVTATMRRTVHSALQDSGLDAPTENNVLIQHMTVLQQRLPLSRPVRLALRNTFRRRGRLIRTLIPLVLGGAIFMSVLSVRASLFTTLEQTLIERGFDVQIQFSQAYPLRRIQAVVGQIEGVAVQEGWSVHQGAPVRADGSQGDKLFLYGLPAETAVFQPRVTAGRWLTPDDTDAVVVPVALLDWEPEVKLGGPLTVRIGNDEHTFTVVGVVHVFQPPITPAIVYANQPYLWQLLGDTNRADMVRILTTQHDSATQRAVAQITEDSLQAAGLQIRSTHNAAEDRRIFGQRFNLITAVLLFMAFLLATVGSLGLMGTMSINVLERRREIGVLRAIGASDGAVIRIFVVEAVVISLIGWVGAVVVSQPMSRFMSYRLGMTFAKLPLDYIFDLRALPLWLVIAVVVAVLSSMLPARGAARMSVRETLTYEG
jgi:putative ABC transport system permease protein